MRLSKIQVMMFYFLFIKLAMVSANYIKMTKIYVSYIDNVVVLL